MLHHNDCTLSIYSSIEETALDRLSSSLIDAGPERFYRANTVPISFTPFRQPIYGNTAPALFFPRVCNAEMDHRLISDLDTFSLSWTWSWTSNETRPAGIVLRDADRDRTTEFHTVLDEIALLPHEFDRTAIALLWHHWRLNATFTITG